MLPKFSSFFEPLLYNLQPEFADLLVVGVLGWIPAKCQTLSDTPARLACTAGGARVEVEVEVSARSQPAACSLTSTSAFGCLSTHQLVST
mmetsp:Transcript_8636/g.12596  ORF Transcript_8636/g.12596 Transcript_8636/m.12596 type:complete len:90 (-) Transcript_8636:96-365(-)